MDPQVVFEPRIAMVEGGYRGHQGISRFMADAFEVMEVRGTDVDEIRDLDDRVLVFGAFHVRGRESGAEDTTPFAILATFRGARSRT
jgi:hypothetical protein